MNTENLLDQYRKMESYCFQTFSQATEKSWGTMFYNPNLPQRHDANHAEVINTNNGMSQIITEVQDFYFDRNIPSRINFYDPDDNHPFKQILNDSDFTCLDIDSPTTFMKLERIISFEEFFNQDDKLRVSFTPVLPKESQIGEDIAKVLHSDWTYQNLVTNNNYFYFILYDKNNPVSVLSYFLHQDYMLARLDDVVTVPEYRNKGYASFLLKFASNWVQNNDFTPYLFVSNDIAKHLYSKTGFKEIISCKRCYWVKE